MRATDLRRRLVSLARAACKRLGRAALPVVAAGALAACGLPQISGPVEGSGRAGAGAVKVALLVPYGSARASDTAVARSAGERGPAGRGRSGRRVRRDHRLSDAGHARRRAGRGGAAGRRDPARRSSSGRSTPRTPPPPGSRRAGSGVPVLSFSNNAAVAGGNVWILGSTFENTARRMLSFAASQGRGRVLLTHSADAAGQAARDAVRARRTRTGAQITGLVGYVLSQAGISAAVRDHRPQARSTRRDRGVPDGQHGRRPAGHHAQLLSPRSGSRRRRWRSSA